MLAAEKKVSARIWGWSSSGLGLAWSCHNIAGWSRNAGEVW
jgi:hypothetical protein